MAYPAIGATIKSARLRRGLTQEQAATACGTSRFHWIRLEQGLHRPLELSGRIAEVLGVEEKDLRGDEDDEEAASLPLTAEKRDALEHARDVLDAILDGRELPRRAEAVA